MPSSAVPIDGVAVEIAAQSQNGKNSFEIRLDPQELGRIDVRLDVDRDGNVTTKLIVDRAETLDLLKRDASNIERTLQDAGLKTSDNTLQFSLRDQQSFTGNDRNNGTGATTARIVLPDDDGVRFEEGVADQDAFDVVGRRTHIGRWGCRSAQQVVRVPDSGAAWQAAADPRTVGLALGV